jgi:cytochrome c-type biogenesis protein CcsB
MERNEEDGMTSNLAMNLAFGLWLLALLSYAGHYLRPGRAWKACGMAGLWMGWAALSAFLALRWRDAGRPPMSNMYESLQVLNWGLMGVFLMLQGRLKVSGMGFWAAALSLAVLALASLMDRSILPLVPALQSNWLIFHVVVIMLAYASLGLAAMGGGLVLVCFPSAKLLADPLKADKAASLDAFSMRAVNLGFVLLTGGIALGSVWANEAWGSYWSWDPKETWSLITWLFYAVVIHLWRTRGWRGQKLDWLNVVGCALVIFTYFGVNYLLAGMHSYAKSGG